MTRTTWLAALALAPGLALAQPARCPASFEAGGPAFLTCTCAPEDINAAAVWGSGPFAMGSAICPAARFAGAIEAAGGVVRLDALPGLPAYAAGSANGVTTRELGAARGSFSVSAPNAPLSFADLNAPPAAPAPAAVAAPVPAAAPPAPPPVAPVVVPPVERVPEEPPVAELPAVPALPPVERVPEEPPVAELPPTAAPPAAAPAPPPAATLRAAGRLTLGVTFRTGAAELDPASLESLARLRDELRADPALRVRIVGHTDSEGGSITNQSLSQRRAAAVAAWLAREGIAPARIVAEGRGETQPVADNATAEGRARNRRVEALRID